jgi:hypothetical protein
MFFRLAFLFETEVLGIFISAIGIIVYASFRSLDLTSFFQENPELEGKFSRCDNKAYDNFTN